MKARDRIELRFAPAIVVAAALSCCGSVPPPTARLEAASATIADAERADAARHAPLELQQARTRLNEAQAAEQNGDNAAAARLAEEAQADARLADVKARASSAETAVTALQSDIQTLRQQTQQSGQQ